MTYIETTCPGCSRNLRVASENAGKAARCPVCNTIYTVPDSSPAHATSDAADRWHMKTPEGQSYGPVSRDVLDRWVAEGRVTDDCKLLLESQGTWQQAGTIYPALRPLPNPPPPRPTFDNPVAPANPGGGPFAAAAQVRVLNAHRGGLIVALGILSWAIGCPVFGIMAWIMGSNDLREMQRGAMDPQGRGLTQAGQIIGMIHALLALLVIVLAVFGLLILGLLG